IDAIVGKLAARRFDAADLRALLAGFVDDGLAGQYRDYAGAEQATMAVGSLLAFLAREGELADAPAANAALDRLHETVRDDEGFRPERFQDALAGVGRAIGARPGDRKESRR